MVSCTAVCSRTPRLHESSLSATIAHEIHNHQYLWYDACVLQAQSLRHEADLNPVPGCGPVHWRADVYDEHVLWCAKHSMPMINLCRWLSLWV